MYDFDEVVMTKLKVLERDLSKMDFGFSGV